MSNIEVNHMRISTKGRYALRMLLDLAEHRESGFVALKDIAERQDISKKYLEQIIPMLSKGSILRTSRDETLIGGDGEVRGIDRLVIRRMGEPDG